MVVGSIEVVPILDAVGRLGDLTELYPQTPAEAWEPYRVLYPDLFAGSSWRLPCACFLIRADTETMLVDTGVGPPGLWEWDAEDEGSPGSGIGRIVTRGGRVVCEESQ